jgi:hypothetical protein
LTLSQSRCSLCSSGSCRWFECRNQGDQIGRIFAYWAIVYVLWAVFEKITEVEKIFIYFFLQHKLTFNFDKNWVGLHFGRTCHKLIWSPWLESKFCKSFEILDIFAGQISTLKAASRKRLLTTFVCNSILKIFDLRWAIRDQCYRLKILPFKGKKNHTICCKNANIFFEKWAKRLK